MTMCTYFGTLKLIIMINLWTSICLQDAQAIRNPFEVVQRCPFNESEWKVRAAHTTCNGSESYHCLLTEGGDSLREQCTDASLFTSGFCPIFTNEGYLQWSACKDTACPTSSYRSDEVYQYQICYKKTDNPKEKNTEKGSNDSSSVPGVTIIIVVILLAFILISVLVDFYRRNQFGFKEKVDLCIFDLCKHFQHRNDTEGSDDVELHVPGQSEPLMQKGKHEGTERNVKKLRKLLKYLVFILKQELSVNDLKEKIVIHSKSIEEHFTTEPLIKELQSVKDLNDYDRLDMSLVFALLRNFCEKIKAPMRGWDYEPPDEENNVAADIERIRSMWNKYCDNDLQFKHIDDVYKRMKLKFGTVPVHGGDGNRKKKDEDDLELLKDKIQSVKLNPDCTVEEGIVITDVIKSALKILNSRNVVVLIGAIGCGKTHALKAIQNHFKSSWETKWKDTLTIESEILQEKPTVLLYDNFFGRFGNSVFSQGEIDRTENVLKAVGGNIKVVIGIHTHVYDEVKKTLRLDFLSQKNITVEMDKLSNAETLLIFKEQRRNGHCKVDSECLFRSIGFQSVLNMLSKNKGHIGGPFLSLMYCTQHELLFDKAFSHNPVQTLVQHFLKVKQESLILYNCLIYLMCVQRHNCQEEPMKWIRETSADITKDAITKMFTTSGYVYVEDNTASLAHDILTIALFKSVADQYLSRVVQNCDVDMMLQLLRPPGTANNYLYCDFMDVNNEENQRTSAKEFVFRYALRMHQGIQRVHPLFTMEFVREKYDKYLLGPPEFMKRTTQIY